VAYVATSNLSDSSRARAGQTCGPTEAKPKFRRHFRALRSETRLPIRFLTCLNANQIARYSSKARRVPGTGHGDSVPSAFIPRACRRATSWAYLRPKRKVHRGTKSGFLRLTAPDIVEVRHEYSRTRVHGRAGANAKSVLGVNNIGISRARHGVAVDGGRTVTLTIDAECKGRPSRPCERALAKPWWRVGAVVV